MKLFGFSVSDSLIFFLAIPRVAALLRLIPISSRLFFDLFATDALCGMFRLIFPFQGLPSVLIVVGVITFNPLEDWRAHHHPQQHD